MKLFLIIIIQLITMSCFSQDEKRLNDFIQCQLGNNRDLVFRSGKFIEILDTNPIVKSEFIKAIEYVKDLNDLRNRRKKFVFIVLNLFTLNTFILVNSIHETALQKKSYKQLQKTFDLAGLETRVAMSDLYNLGIQCN